MRMFCVDKIYEIGYNNIKENRKGGMTYGKDTKCS